MPLYERWEFKIYWEVLSIYQLSSAILTYH